MVKYILLLTILTSCIQEENILFEENNETSVEAIITFYDHKTVFTGVLKKEKSVYSDQIGFENITNAAILLESPVENNWITSDLFSYFLESPQVYPLSSSNFDLSIDIDGEAIITGSTLALDTNQVTLNNYSLSTSMANSNLKVDLYFEFDNLIQFGQVTASVRYEASCVDCDTIIYKTSTVSQYVTGFHYTDLNTKNFETQLNIPYNEIRSSLALENTNQLQIKIESIELELTTISEDYFLYLNDIEKSMILSQDPFSEPVFIHSNLSNGIGIFGAKRIEIEAFSINDSIICP